MYNLISLGILKCMTMGFGKVFITCNCKSPMTCVNSKSPVLTLYALCKL